MLKRVLAKDNGLKFTDGTNAGPAALAEALKLSLIHI